MKAKACAKKLTFQILFLAFAVCMNYFGSVCAGKIILPLYLDSIMTIAATAICGLWGGVLCAVLSNLAMYIFDRTMFVFVSSHILTAVFAWLTFHHHKRVSENELPTLDTFLWAGVWSAASNAVLGNILSVSLFSASTIENVDNIVQGIYLATENIPFALCFGGTVTNLADKMISAAVSYGVSRAVKKIYSFFG